MSLESEGAPGAVLSICSPALLEGSVGWVAGDGTAATTGGVAGVGAGGAEVDLVLGGSVVVVVVTLGDGNVVVGGTEAVDAVWSSAETTCLVSARVCLGSPEPGSAARDAVTHRIVASIAPMADTPGRLAIHSPERRREAS
jgi:hypothetical protein